MLFNRFAAVLLLAGCFSGLVHATPVQWTLNNGTFSDGGTATGSFVYDASTNTFSQWAISVSGGSQASSFPAFTYSTSNSIVLPTSTNLVAIFGDQTQTVPGSPSQFRTIRLALTSAMTDAGGVRTLSSGAAVECFDCNPARLLSGTLTGTALTPEPGTAAMLFGGAVVFLTVRRRRLALK